MSERVVVNLNKARKARDRAEAKAQADANVGQSPRVRPIQRIAAPDPADVGEHCATDAEQAPGVPVGEVALLDAQTGIAFAACPAQRIAAQAGVAAEVDAVVEVELVSVLRFQLGEEQSSGPGLAVVAQVAGDAQIAGFTVFLAQLDQARRDQLLEEQKPRRCPQGHGKKPDAHRAHGTQRFQGHGRVP